MHGARWGWVAFIVAVAILFAAHKEEGPSASKQLPILRKELHAALAERDQAWSERNEARDLAQQFEESSLALDRRLAETREALQQVQAEQVKLRQELARVSTDRVQLQQTISSLQAERELTKRNVEQLRQGLHHLLNQAETVAANLAVPAPGVAQVDFEGGEASIAISTSTPVTTPPVDSVSLSGIPLNKNP
jgi:seryl-tRNA synthetase